MVKASISIGNKTKITSLAAAVALLGLGAIQVQGQSILYNFSDNTSDGWANAGFSGSPLATVSTIGGQNYIYLPLGGFQVGNVSASSGSLFNAMAAAAANPSGYDISYNYYIDTSTFVGASFLQFGTFWNQGGGYYGQNYGSPNEVQLSGAQIATGAVFQGTVTINVGAIYTPVAGDTFYRLGLIENADSTSTGVGVYVTDISVSPVPEPATLSLFGLGLAAGAAFLRRRKA
jgi:hypothetical protein